MFGAFEVELQSGTWLVIVTLASQADAAQSM